MYIDKRALFHTGEIFIGIRKRSFEKVTLNACFLALKAGLSVLFSVCLNESFAFHSMHASLETFG